MSYFKNFLNNLITYKNIELCKDEKNCSIIDLIKESTYCIINNKTKTSIESYSNYRYKEKYDKFNISRIINIIDDKEILIYKIKNIYLRQKILIENIKNIEEKVNISKINLHDINKKLDIKYNKEETFKYLSLFRIIYDILILIASYIFFNIIIIYLRLNKQ